MNNLNFNVLNESQLRLIYGGRRDRYYKRIYKFGRCVGRNARRALEMAIPIIFG